MAAPRTVDVGQRLLQIKRDLEEKREIRAQLRGEVAGFQRQLISDFKVENLEAAQKLIEKKRQEIEEAEKDIQAGLAKIEELMEVEDEEE
jgi:acyl-[acyl carrier protein]--UDP-N-acetylglucosamine O-acyltransferase